MAQAISAILPSFIFSTRRTNNGFDAVDHNNPAVALMNWNIASGQMFKAAKETVNAAKGVKTAVASKIVSAEEAIKNLAYGDEILEGVGKVVDFTSKNINPLICATGVVKVACSDDKQSAAIQELTALLGMFGLEKTGKILLGLPQKKWVNGKRISYQEEALLKSLTKNNVFIQSKIKAITDYSKTSELLTKALKYAPGIVKGLGFVTLSILGYKIGSYIGDKIAKFVKDNQTETQKANEIALNPNNTAKEISIVPRQMLSLTSKSA